MQKSISLENFLFWILSGLIFLLPILFIPVVSVPLLLIKYSLFILAVVAALAVWITLRLKDGVCLLPINILSISGIFALLVMLVSSLLSGSKWNSLIGQLGQTDTFLFYLCVFVIMLMLPSVYNTSKRIFNLYKIFFVSLSLLIVFHIIRLILGAGWLSFGYFPNITDNVLGKWNDLGIFFGLGAALSLMTLEMLTLSKVKKIIVYIALVLSTIILAVINFASIWYVLGALSLVFFVYSIVLARSSSAKKAALTPFPITSFVMFLISVIFIIGGTAIGGFISPHFNISQAEVAPTWQATIGIAKNVVVQKNIVQSIFGVGPNRFLNEWFLFKPDGVNNSIFWNTDFNAGTGIVPTSIVTTGILGLLSWILFLGAFLYLGFRSILSKISDPLQKYLITSTFLASLYLWIFNIVYVPSLVIIVLTFFFTGLFLSTLYGAGTLKAVRFEYFKNPKIGFISVFVFIIILICGLGLIYTTASKLVAASYYNQGISEVNNNNLDAGESKIKSAISFDSSNDLYVRSLAQIYLVRLKILLGSNAGSASADAIKSQFSNISNTALSAASFAISINESNYQNWLTLGDVWSSLAPLKIDKSYENALGAYQKAFSYNPQNPYIYLEQARLESYLNNSTQATGNIAKAISLKNNYTDAYLFLAQLQISSGDVKSAINSVSLASASSPNNPDILFQLGVLLYDNKDYQNAIGALEQAVALNGQYSNAKYFLGLSYYQVNRTKDAVVQFTDLQKLNPGNQQIVVMLNNLQNGKSPLPKNDTSSKAVSSKKK